jgi:hypothetical protein
MVGLGRGLGRLGLGLWIGSIGSRRGFWGNWWSWWDGYCVRGCNTGEMFTERLEVSGSTYILIHWVNWVIYTP